MSENDSFRRRISGGLRHGAIAGAAVALLYAPQYGEETRKLIASKSKEIKGKAQDALHDAKEFIDEKKSEITAASRPAKKRCGKSD